MAGFAPQPKASLADLLVSARAGSKEALGRLLDEFRPYLLQVALEELDPDLRVKEAPSDLVQKSFMEAARDFKSFAKGSPEELKAWLRKILLHNLHDVRARYQTEKRKIAREVDAALDDGSPLSQADSEQTSPSGVAIRHEQTSNLEMALQKLAPDDRQLMILRHQQRRTFAEIAEVLNLTEVATRKRWARAVEELRQMVHGPGPSLNR